MNGQSFPPVALGPGTSCDVSLGNKGLHITQLARLEHGIDLDYTKPVDACSHDEATVQDEAIEDAISPTQPYIVQKDWVMCIV